MAYPVTVQLDTTATAYPGAQPATDISGYVLASDGDAVSITRGRQDEQSQITPSDLEFKLVNTDGRFTPGRTGLLTNLFAPDVAAPGCVTGGTTQFVAGGGGTLAIDTAGHTTGNRNSLRVTVAAGTAASSVAHTATFPVTVGSGYSAGVDFDNTAAGTVGVRVRINFLDGSGTILSGTPGNIIAATSSGTSTVSNAIAPASAVTARLDLVTTAVPGAPAVFYAGNLEAEQATSPAGEKVAPYYPRIRRRARTHVTITIAGTTTELLDTYANSWVTSYDESRALWVTDFSGSDILARMGADSPLRGALAEQMALGANSASVIFPFGEDRDSTSFGDLLGHAAAATIGNSKYGAGVVETGQQPTGSFIPDAIVMLENVTGSAPSPGSWLSIPLPTQSGAVLIEGWFQLPSVAQGGTLFCTSGLVLTFDAAGFLHLTLYDTAHNGVTAMNAGHITFDGCMHQIAVSVDPAAPGTITSYVDGAVAATATAGTALAAFLGATLDIGMTTQVVGTTGGFTVLPYGPFAGGVAYVAVLPLATSSVANDYLAGTTAFSGELTGDRITRLLTYRPNLGASLDTGRSRVGAGGFSGTLADELLAVGDAEAGLVFAGARGKIVLRGRGTMFNPSSTATFDASLDAVTVGSELRDDAQDVVNDVTVTIPAGAVQRYVNAASVAQDGPAAQSLDLNLASAADALSIAGWLVANGTQDQVAFPTLTVDLLHCGDSTAQAAVRALPGDAITVANLPSPLPPSLNLIVEGSEISLAADAQTVVLHLGHMPVAVAVWDSTTWDSAPVWAP